jgi:histone demethylase JARID1
VHYQQLDALSKQANSMPVTPETLAAVEAILKKQRDAQELIQSLYERSKDPDFRQRPKYKEVRDAMEALNALNSKPAGTIDLEKEQKRHEDWMRRGKKLFGKANAPLHILHAHMKQVDDRNKSCFDLSDQPRMPVEPASREASPVEGETVDGSGSSRDVFCICRKPEAGMMIECELCHEW